MEYESTIVDVDETPHSAAASRDGSRIYISHFLPGTVSVIDTRSNSVERTIAVTPGLYGIAAHPDNEHIYVAENDSGFVKRIHLGGDSDIHAGIGATPYGIAIDPAGTSIFVTAPLNGTIEVLDPLVRNDSRINYSGFPVQVAVGSDGNLLYLTEYFGSSVVVLDISRLESGDFHFTPEVVSRIPVDANPYGISLGQDGDRAFVAHFGSEDIVSIIDLRSQEVVDRVRTGHGMIRGVTTGAGGSRIYVTNYFSKSVSAIDL
ncbi:hypothetical protein [Nocardia sp. NPDC003345]